MVSANACSASTGHFNWPVLFCCSVANTGALSSQRYPNAFSRSRPSARVPGNAQKWTPRVGGTKVDEDRCAGGCYGMAARDVPVFKHDSESRDMSSGVMHTTSPSSRVIRPAPLTSSFPMVGTAPRAPGVFHHKIKRPGGGAPEHLVCVGAAAHVPGRTAFCTEGHGGVNVRVAVTTPHDTLFAGPRPTAVEVVASAPLEHRVAAFGQFHAALGGGRIHSTHQLLQLGAIKCSHMKLLHALQLVRLGLQLAVLVAHDLDDRRSVRQFGRVLVHRLHVEREAVQKRPR
eukprot:ctg_221.g88